MRFVGYVVIFILLMGCTPQRGRHLASIDECNRLILEILQSDLERIGWDITNRELSYRQFSELMFDLKRSMVSKQKALDLLNQSPLISEARLKKAEIDELASFISSHVGDDMVDFSSRLSDHVFKYDIQIPRITVRDQCDIGNCWIHAGTSFHEILYRDVLSDAPLSAEYFTVVNLIEVVRTYAKELSNLNSSFAGRSFLRGHEGGSMEVFRELVEMYGAIPQKSWKPNIDLSRYGEYQILYDDITRRMQELFKGQRRISEREIDRAIKNEIIPIIEGHVGALPKRVSHNGKRLSPKRFAENFFQFDVEGRSFIIKIKPENYDATGIRHSVKATIVEEIDKGNPVILVFRGRKSALPSDSGLLSDATYGAMRGRHQVVVVGYKLDSRGNIRRLKLANSWGEASGDNGYLHMTGRYLWQTFDSLGVALD